MVKKCTVQSNSAYSSIFVISSESRVLGRSREIFDLFFWITLYFASEETLAKLASHFFVTKNIDLRLVYVKIEDFLEIL